MCSLEPSRDITFLFPAKLPSLLESLLTAWFQAYE